ncbi:MAG: DNA polymerase III subunit delta', partial [Rhizomicrobium sp.]
MPKRTREEEPFESDRIAGQAHPRETLALIGQDEALARAARAIRGGRPPQAWLIGGPPGIGKATFAYRVARYLLAYGASSKGPEDLSVPANDAVVPLVRAGAHPGLLVLKRGLNPETGKPMTVLGVDEIRRLANFFGLTSGAGGWRVAIIDAADDMNDSAANALLK